MDFSLIQTLRQKLDVPEAIDCEQYPNLVSFYKSGIDRYRDQPAYSCLGHTITYNELDDLSDAFAAYLQHNTPLEAGDKIAIQLPNILQQPVAVLGAFKAGLVVVNTNPLYTERELKHQFNDSEAKALVILANVADKASSIIAETGVETVILTELADLHSPVKSTVLNFAVKYIKKMVPEFSLPQAVSFKQVIKQGKGLSLKTSENALSDLAVLQYTGGTTGASKGAMLSHANLLANALQSSPFFHSYGMPDNGAIVVQPLPLYHIFAFIVGLICLNTGAHTILIPNPRDLPSLLKEMKKNKMDGFCGLNTLFAGLLNHKDFSTVDFSSLQMTLSGGMALTSDVAKKWTSVTGCDVYEGYGLTETSPVVAVNTGKGNCLGSVGVVLPNTVIDIRDDEGKTVEPGDSGELCVKGPQVMQGYWQNAEATEQVLKDGWLETGDIATLTEEGYLKIVDRKKDVIIVSGFNVFPNEVEDVATSHPDIIEAAAIGEKDPACGEVVHLYVVSKDKNLTEQAVIQYCRENLTGYKVPKKVVFRDELPKTNVGKVLRRLVKEGIETA